ncbi:MAG TPA: polysaccharide deacetylase family protein [Acidimicrobiales bacterium]|nr:polysaccharide deacetylase family protein [Acidimicrobiales bacterium]
MPSRSVRQRLRRIGVRRVYRSDAAAVRMRVERRALTAIHARRTAPAPLRDRILCYHAVGTPSWGANNVPPQRFARQLDLAHAAGYRFAAPHEVASTASHTTGDAPRLAITFDDGLKSVRTHAWPLLATRGIPCTIFVVSDWTDAASQDASSVLLGWDELARLVAEGVRIGSHSRSHRDFMTLSSAEVEEELSTPRRAIAARLGIDAREFAIPYGQSMNWDASLSTRARHAGYDVLYAQSVLRRPAGTVARTFVTRFDDDRTFVAALEGAFDDWEEWV